MLVIYYKNNNDNSYGNTNGVSVWISHGRFH